ncbi:hypothetical protein [Streptomyces hawaiiensis]|uniref:Gliding motility protein n=1 Tax=Streptomyces hawaiiensis TaxID=67305 RepID=A0A6G5RM53_9ACTN|nr:hypothetical protein [Streptomyces hawaiiensis]QCD58657.1 hypothetical protein CEB94_30310 [Streptomyces hawaiiensis]
MGVFARILRRSKATAETPAAEAQTDTAKAGPEAEAAESAETKGTDGAEEAAEPAGEATAEATESEGVDIPKQQSTEKAADNEAGEGART